MIKLFIARFTLRSVPIFTKPTGPFFQQPTFSSLSHIRRLTTPTESTTPPPKTPDTTEQIVPKFRFNENPQIPVKSFKTGDVMSQIMLNRDIFNVPLRQDILHQVVVWQLASKRAGTACTKDRSEVAGSGRKLYAQKHTGKARAGNKKAGQRRGGGTTHGPKPKDWSYPLNKKVRKLGLKTVLSTKLAQGKLLVVGDLNEFYGETKTKEIVKTLKNLSLDSVVVIDEEINENFKRATGNLIEVLYLPVEKANVYDILRKDTVILTPQSVQKIGQSLGLVATV